MSPRVEVYENPSAIPESGMALFRSAEPASFDLGAAWFDLLSSHALSAGSRARYYALLDDDVRCILPLRFGDRRLVSGLTTFYTTLFRPLLGPGLGPESLAPLIRRAMDDAGAGSIRLDAMETEHPSFATTMAAMRLAGLRPYCYFSHGNWFLPAQGLSFDDYFSALPGRVRNTVRRGEKKFLSEGRGRVEIIRGDPSDLERAIDAWDRVYAASWKRPEPFPGFMPGLIRLCAERRWLRMGVAYHDETPIAAQIWIVNAGHAAIYKLAYDQAYARFSAGTILTARLMRQVLDEDSVDEVDYLVGDDAYKKDWMASRRERMGIVAYDWRRWPGLSGMLLQELGQVRRCLWRIRKPVP